MRKKIRIGSGALLIGALALVLALTGANAAAAGPGNVTLTVTAVGKKDMAAPAVTREDVQFFLNKERTQIANWRRGEKLFLRPATVNVHFRLLRAQWRGRGGAGFHQ